MILSDISRTKLWSSSVVRCMAWHPQTTKLAVVSSHDIIYVYNRKGSEAKIQKNTQSAILSLAWRLKNYSFDCHNIIILDVYF